MWQGPPGESQASEAHACSDWGGPWFLVTSWDRNTQSSMWLFYSSSASGPSRLRKLQPPSSPGFVGADDNPCFSWLQVCRLRCAYLWPFHERPVNTCSSRPSLSVSFLTLRPGKRLSFLQTTGHLSLSRLPPRSCLAPFC